MECDVLIEIVSVKHNSGGGHNVDSVNVIYGDYQELKELERSINETNYSKERYFKKAFIKTLDLTQLK
jgi:hypothetical protein